MINHAKIRRKTFQGKRAQKGGSWYVCGIHRVPEDRNGSRELWEVDKGRTVQIFVSHSKGVVFFVFQWPHRGLHFTKMTTMWVMDQRGPGEKSRTAARRLCRTLGQGRGWLGLWWSRNGR